MANDTFGFDATKVSTTPEFTPGTRVETDRNRAFVYVKATAAIALYDAVTYDETFQGVVAPLGTANDARGDSVGVAPVAIPSGSYGWLQVRGPCTMNVLANCAANVRLNTTATAGSLDDDGGVGSMQVQGAYLTTARGGTNGSAAAILHNPFIDVTL